MTVYPFLYSWDWDFCDFPECVYQDLCMLAANSPVQFICKDHLDVVREASFVFKQLNLTEP